MTDRETAPAEAVSLEEVRQGWGELKAKVAQFEAERAALEKENKLLRVLLERSIEHRQKSHGELVLLLTALVSKLPLNDVGVIISKLVEHNTNVNQYLAALVKGTADAPIPQPALLKTLEQTKKELMSALHPLADELMRLETPLEGELLQCLLNDPELFFSPRVLRANRCFIKGLVPRERVLREFGAEALPFFVDTTTDAKLNPRPKPEEIALAFKNDFEALLEQSPQALPGKREALLALYKRVQRSKSATPEARTQRNVFQKLSFLIELLHYYEHQNTEPADVMFAQRLPALVEQLGLSPDRESPDESLVKQAEELLHYIISPDQRLMVINNVGKGGEECKTLKYVLRFRAEKSSEFDQVVPEFARHLIPTSKAPPAEKLTPILKLLPVEAQKSVVRGLMHCDRLRKTEAETLGRAVASQLGLADFEAQAAAKALPPEVERQMAWVRIKDMIGQRADAGKIANAIRERLNAKYDADEIRESWIALTEADALTLILVFCLLPYLPSGKTDPIARPVLETYVSRLMHEKYASTQQKIVTSLRNMYRAKPDAPTLVNFLALVRWVDPEAANRLSAQVGMAVAA